MITCRIWHHTEHITLDQSHTHTHSMLNQHNQLMKTGNRSAAQNVPLISWCCVFWFSKKNVFIRVTCSWAVERLWGQVLRAAVCGQCFCGCVLTPLHSMAILTSSPASYFTLDRLSLRRPSSFRSSTTRVWWTGSWPCPAQTTAHIRSELLSSKCLLYLPNLATIHTLSLSCIAENASMIRKHGRT